MSTNTKAMPTSTLEIIADIKHAMEMYPAEEVEFIVRAVNAHDELVAALKRAIELLAAEIDLPVDQCVGGVFKDLRAVLAKAEAQP